MDCCFRKQTRAPEILSESSPCVRRELSWLALEILPRRNVKCAPSQAPWHPRPTETTAETPVTLGARGSRSRKDFLLVLLVVLWPLSSKDCTGR